MSVLLNAICVFVCCSKLVASIPFPEEYVRRYLAAANGASALTGMQGQLQNQQTGLNPSQVPAYVGQLNNAHSQPIYAPIPGAENYVRPINNVGMNLDFPRNFERASYEAMRGAVPVQASAQAAGVYPQMINQIPQAWEQDLYNKQLQQSLQQLKGTVSSIQIPYNQQFITGNQMQQVNTNPPNNNVATQAFGSNMQQLQKAEIIRQNIAGPENHQHFPFNNGLNRKQSTGSEHNEKHVAITNSQPQEMDAYINNPRIQNIISTTKLKKRYLVVHPDGTVNHVDSLEEVIKENPNYVLLNSGHIKASHLPSTNTQATASTVTDRPQNKPSSDIKQFRVTEVTTTSKKPLPKVQDKPIINKSKSNIEKNVDSQQNKVPVKIPVKSNKESEAIATASTSTVNKKVKIENKKEQVNESSSTNSDNSKAAKKSSIKFSVKNSSESVKTDKKESAKKSSANSSESHNETISKDNKPLLSESKSSTGKRKSLAKNTASANKNDNKKSTKGVETKHNKESIGDNERVNNNKNVASTIVSSSTSDKNSDYKKTRKTSTKNTLNKVSATSTSSTKKNRKEAISQPTAKINNKTANEKTTKVETDQENTLKVIPVTKDVKKVTKANNKSNSIVGSNDSALSKAVEKPIKTETANEEECDGEKDSGDETSKMLNLLKDIKKEDMKDKVLILLVLPPILDRDVHTTIYPDGTIIDEITETTWDSDDEDAEPKVVTRTKVRHVNDPPTKND